MKVSINSAFAVLGVLAACGSVPAKPDASSPTGDGQVADVPVDIPIKACTATVCTNDVLEVCGSDGMVERFDNCALGCFDNTRCNALSPTNGLATHLDQAAAQSDVVLPNNTTINSDTGAVSGPSGTIVVATATVAQSGGPQLRVMIAKTWDIGNVRVTGSAPIAFVASGDITINGALDASADLHTGGPGAQGCAGTGAGGAPGSGHFERLRAGATAGYPTYVWEVDGSGGGGFGTAGGTGGDGDSTTSPGAGGGANGNATLAPLRGGCPGYTTTGTVPGAGGGAIQLVSSTRVRLVNGATKGVVNVGGGGGRAAALGRNDVAETTPVYPSTGGGSGGGLLIEAPLVVLEDNTALLAAGGGGGGFGACAGTPIGQDAPSNANTATGGACPAGTTPAASGGDGATSGNGAIGGNAPYGAGGSGGGGLGRIRINTANGQFTSAAGSLVRGTSSTGTVAKR